MTLTMTLGGTSLPLPRADGPFDMDYIPFGVQHRTKSGSLRIQLTGTAWTIRAFWEGLTKAERDSLFAVHGGAIATQSTLVMPDGVSLEVMTSLGSWTERQWYDYAGTAYYDVSFSMETV